MLGVVAFQQLARSAGVLYVFQPSRHLAERIGDDFAVLCCEPLGDFVLVLLHEFSEAEQDGDALCHAHLPPRGKSFLGRGNGVVYFCDRGEIHLAGLFAGGRVEDRA